MNLDDLPDLNSEVPLWLATHTIIQEKTGRETGNLFIKEPGCLFVQDLANC